MKYEKIYKISKNEKCKVQIIQLLLMMEGDLPTNDELKLKEFVCGWIAAIAQITITYPIYKIQVRQMILGLPVHKVILQLHKEGLFYLYRGVLPPQCQKTLGMSIMFGVYENTQRLLHRHTDLDIYTKKVISSFASGTVESVLVPFERVQTLLQNSKHNNRFKNMIHTFKEVRQYGFLEYYRGFTPLLTRNIIAQTIFFLVRDEVRRLIPGDNHNSFKNSVIHFFQGALIGASISSLLYPFSVVKVVMQKELGGKFENYFHVFSKIYDERGRSIQRLYSGLTTNWIRAFFSWGIMTCAYEFIKNVMD